MCPGWLFDHMSLGWDILANVTYFWWWHTWRCLRWYLYICLWWNTLNILFIIILYLFTWYWCCVADALYYSLLCWHCVYCILMFMYVHLISFAGCYYSLEAVSVSKIDYYEWCWWRCSLLSNLSAMHVIEVAGCCSSFVSWSTYFK